MLVLTVGFLLPGALEAQRGDVRQPAGPPRAVLERQIIQRFVQQTAAEMALEPETRRQLQELLEESNRERRGMFASSLELQRSLRDAIRDPATPDTEYARLLAEANALRRMEHERWQRDQSRIAELLTPRQQAIFVLRWIRMQERIQEMINTRPRGSGPPFDTLE
jgi:DNA-directed RNA polymerase sigma subunit (sigma70/sigma32)